MKAPGANPLFGPRKTVERAEAERRAADAKVRRTQERRNERNAAKRERAEAAQRAVEGLDLSLTRHKYHSARVFYSVTPPPAFFWTTESVEGVYLSGVMNERDPDLVIDASISAHTLRREARERAKALSDGWHFGSGKRLW